MENLKKKILIAEEEADIRILLAKILENEGYNVTIAKDGLEALDLILANQQSFDLLISDLGIPGKTGKELLEIFGQSLPIIIMTGRAKEEVEQELLNLGAKFVVAKPFKATPLLLKISSLFSR